MRLVQTDDQALRLEFKWLGPVNMPMPVPARGAAWITGVLLWGPMTFVVGALLPEPIITRLVSGPAAVLVHFALTMTLATLAAVLAVRAVGRRVTPTRPVRHHLAVLRAELNDPREQDEREVILTTPTTPTTPIEHERTTATT